MHQKGMSAGAIVPVDNLQYNYFTNSNRLSSITDNGSTTAKLGDFKDGNTGNNDYSYDRGGNLTTDLNKGITAITYNYLNQPLKIELTGRGNISYTYDAAGRKLQKIVTDMAESVPQKTISDYDGPLVYENDSLIHVGFGDGRLRVNYFTNESPSFEFDYFVKDYLGSVRAVVTENQVTSTYVATMESSNSSAENSLFSNIDNTREPLPAGYPTDATTNPNQYVSKLNAHNGSKIGPSLVLRVMAGDKVQIGTTAFYKSAAANNKNSNLDDMLASIVNSFAGTSGLGGTHGSTTTNTSPISTNFSSSDLQSFMEKNKSPDYDQKPKAYLNYVLFDDQFKMVDNNSGIKQLQSLPDQLQTLTSGGLEMRKSGLLYIYSSNESAENVYFDNLVVNHTNGRVIEESHYYPFGLTMAGLNVTAMKGGHYRQNKQLFTSQLLDNDLDWNTYQMRWRTMDPQTGRFLQIDPLAQKYLSNSPYAYAENKFTMGIDIDGMELLPINTAWFKLNAEKTYNSNYGNAVFWKQQVDLNANNIPRVFKDNSGNPLFSAASVNVGPSGIIKGIGSSLKPDNDLPASPDWTFASNAVDGFPDDLSSHAQGTSYGTLYSRGRYISPMRADPGRWKMESDVRTEVLNNVKLYKNDLPIWNAYNALNAQSSGFDMAVNIVDRSNSFMAQTAEGKAALTNFVNDGSLPNFTKDFIGSLQNSINVLSEGIKILQQSGTEVKPETLEQLSMFQDALKQFNQKKNKYSK